MGNLRYRLKLLGGLVVFIWLVSPLPEISIAFSFILSAFYAEMPLVYAVPASVMLGLGFKEILEYLGLESRMKKKLRRLKQIEGS